MDRVSLFHKLDIFTKIDSSFTRSSPAGGTVSLFTYIVILFLVFAEFANYLNSDILFNYSVDTEFDKKLDINVDLTVATPCSNIGADILDVTNKHSMYTYGKLDEKNTKFKLTPDQQNRWNLIKEFNTYIRNQHHNIHQLMWKSDAHQVVEIDEKPFVITYREQPYDKPDACRLYGTLTVNKVSGNFHIATGKYLPLPIGHAHISLIGSDRAVNFSHRIEKFSFGQEVPGIVNTLDGIEKITNHSSHLYQYYLKVVLTHVHTANHQAETYQYSITERDFAVNHDAGAHGIPGIYFKYEIDGLKIDISQDTIPIWKFCVRLCSIVGGIFAISGFTNQLVTYLLNQ